MIKSMLVKRQTILEDVVILIFTVAFFNVVNLNISGPVVQGDEGGYLGYGALLAGYNLYSYSSYKYGYSLFISPAFIFGGNPFEIYKYVLFINSIIWGVSFVVLKYIFVELYNKSMSKRRLYAALFVSMLYPSWVSYSGYAFSENAFILLFVLSVYFLVNSYKGIYYWIPFALSLALMFFVNDRSLPIILSAVIVLFIQTIKTKSIYPVLITFFSFFMAIYLWSTTIANVVELNLIDTSYRATQNLYNLLERSLLNFKLNWGFFVGHLFYLGGASLLLGFIGLAYMVKAICANLNNPEYEINSLIYGYIILAFTGTLLMSVIFFSSAQPNVNRLDIILYGRYLEPLLIIILGVGILKFNDLYYLRSLLFYILLLILLYLFLELDNLHIFHSNIPSFWPLHINGLGYKILLPLIFLPILIIYLVKYELLRIVIILTVFLYAIYSHNRVHMENVASHGDRHDLAKYIRDEYKPGTCVVFDRGSSKNWWHPTFYSHYLFYLYDYKFEKGSFEYWLNNCNGPFLSWNEILPYSTKSDTFKLKKEKRDGPYLYIKTLPGKILGMYDRVVINSFQTASRYLFGNLHEVEDDGVWSSGKAGIKFKSPSRCIQDDNCYIDIDFLSLNASRLKIYVNDQFLSEYTNNKQQLEKIRVPLVSLSCDNKSDECLSYFRVELDPDVVESPFELGLSMDKRKLGVKFLAFNIGKN